MVYRVINPRVLRYYKLIQDRSRGEASRNTFTYDDFTAQDYRDLIAMNFDHKTKKKKHNIPVQALIHWQKQADEMDKIEDDIDE